MRKRTVTHVLILLIVGIVPMTALSDEGMWLLNEPPRELLQKKYNFDLTDAWLKHAQGASIRFNNGGSASFLSADGLIITNHHVASDSIQKLSNKERNYLRDGFYAATREAELKAPDLELNVLREIVDVTEQVNAAVKPEMKPAESAAARRAVMSAIEKESLDKTGLRSDIVTLYQGGAYHLYRYKKYTDIRLVFAPEEGIASFGGDVDNFEFPRFGLDITFFRAYENDKPAKIDQWLKISATGPADGDLVFVTGHPGTTNRLETFEKLRHRRDASLPYTLARLRALEAAILQYSDRGPEQRRQAATDLHSAANARKAFSGQYQGLLTPSIMATKRSMEQELLTKIKALDRADAPDRIYQQSIERISEIQKVFREFEKEYLLLEFGHGFTSSLFSVARHIVRHNTEVTKPNADRLREYRESNLESLKYQLFSPAPIYSDLERIKLQTSITFLAEQLGGEHPMVVKILGGKSPAQRVDELLAGTKLLDVAERKRLVEGGAKAIDDSRDTMIVFARLIDEDARRLRKRYEDQVEEPERQAYGEIAKLRFQVLGRTVAPDATFTLRVAFGVVKGYEVEGTTLPHCTTFKGLFERADALGYRHPFDVPKRWLDGKSKLDLSTPFNFASTADTIGGNSGSPVLNRAGEFVGINFDRNRHGLVRNFVYTEVQARHISVHSRGILEALRKLYDCPALLKELTSKE